MKQKVHAYLIRWRDSCSFRGWHSANDDHAVATINSVGWIVREDKKSVTISTSISENASIMDGLTIPREAIVRKRRLPQYLEGN